MVFKTLVILTLAGAVMTSMPTVAQPKTPSGTLNSSSRFVTRNLPYGITLNVPRAWRSLTPELDEALKTSRDALMNAINHPNSMLDDVTLMHIYSDIEGAFASIRIERRGLPDSKAYESMQMTSASSMEAPIRSAIVKGAKLTGMPITRWHGVRKTTISGNPAIVLTYDRADPGGEYQAEVTQIYTRNQKVTFTTSFRLDERILHKPILVNAARSLNIND